MLQLTAKAGDRLPLGYAVLFDPEAKDHTALEIKPHEIIVHSGSISIEPNRHIERLNQRISYKRQEDQVRNRRAKVEDFQPILRTIASGDVQQIQYLSYFSGEEETVTALPQRDLLDKQVSDKDVQAFCTKVYSLYTRNKNNS